ncbi:RidA family protein [Aeoliella mucimassa]|uniref:Endoribonuclease L-PSP n=1 Tax=Aeoliella mucimassa TaxID=2527972 RepID=A0A518AVP7_9BACT|nr:hypothetical protein [Aeoliella mucimassa]QDU58817.1 Endoribonuclease L-PSP [Aeoliella mucimassa]
MQVETRRVVGEKLTELYLTVSPNPRQRLVQQAVDAMIAIRDALQTADAYMLCERYFATPEAMEVIRRFRRDTFIDVDDGIQPTYIAVEPGAYGQFAGAQLHAVVGPQKPVPLRCTQGAGGVAGRRLQNNGSTWVYINGMHSDVSQCEVEQAKRMFYCTGCFLRQAGASMRSVARTWLWLRDICDWYDGLNSTRNRFFQNEGLIDPQHGSVHLPASTGIGMYGANGAACTLDAIAMPGAEDQIELLEAGGDQESAFEYGSAFSRAAIAPMPAGPTLFVSGTAAIDRAGVTEHVGQMKAQIDDTIEHIRALLRQGNCRDDQVLTALVYCKSPEVEQMFRTRCFDLPWPHLTMIGDVCRPELLFEVEVTASPVYERSTGS